MISFQPITTFSDVLNRVFDCRGKPESGDDSRAMDDAARHVAKYIFPLQHGLHNVFSCPLQYWDNGGRFRDYGDREAEIRVRDRK
jgi:hypothetical protein